MADDHREAARFLSALAPDGELTFQTFDDAKSGARGLSRVLHGRFGQHANRLEDLNERGAGCFVMVNRGDMVGRKEGNVQAVRALFLDLDGAPLDPVMAAPLPPPITCESSPGKYHAYWPVADVPLSAFRTAQKALAAKYRGDPKVCDLPRVMRLPGFLHKKTTPYRSRLLRCDPMKPWIWSDFAERMGLAQQSPKRDAGGYVEGERNDAMFRFACGLKREGHPMDTALRRAAAANQSRYLPPLEWAEVLTIVQSAYKRESVGYIQLSYTLLDDPDYLTLPSDGKAFLSALLRQHNGNNNGMLTFTCEDALRWGMDKRRRRNAATSVEQAGFVEYTQRGMAGCKGRRAIPDRFRLLFLP